MCNLRKRPEYIENESNSNLDSFTIHNGANKNIKDRVQTNVIKIDDCTYTSRDFHDISLRSDPKQKLNNATQTAGDRKSSSTGRVHSCDNCSKSIPDDELVNIFLHKKWFDDDEKTDDNNVKFEVVGKVMPQATRFEIIENVPVKDDESVSTTLRSGNTQTSNISIPIRPSSRLKSEVFIMINECLPKEDGSDEVFK